MILPEPYSSLHLSKRRQKNEDQHEQTLQPPFPQTGKQETHTYSVDTRLARTRITVPRFFFPGLDAEFR
jgi:hypothetical protein